jgi:hypothetical protein
VIYDAVDCLGLDLSTSRYTVTSRFRYAYSLQSKLIQELNGNKIDTI